MEQILDHAEVEIALNPNEKKYRFIEKLVLSGILALVLIGYFALFFNKAFPYSEGWHPYYCELVNNGKVPYRDFYYFLPPLNLTIDYIFWTLSFNSLLMFRVWRVLERVAMMVAIFFLLSKKFDAKIAFLGCIFGGIIGSADTYDLLGDYNQTAIFLFILSVFPTIKFINEKNVKKKYFNITVAGFILGLLFLSKQTYGLFSVLAYLIFLGILCFINKDKKFLWYVLWAGVGFLIPVVLYVVVLASFGALIPAIQQIFGGASTKGGLFVVLFWNIGAYFASNILINLALLVSFILVVGMNFFVKRLKEQSKPTKWSEQKRDKFYKVCIVSTLVLAILLFLGICTKQGIVFLATNVVFWVLLGLALIFVAYEFLLLKSTKLKAWHEKIGKNKAYYFLLSLVVVWLVVEFVIFLSNYQYKTGVVEFGSAVDFRGKVINFIAFVLSVWFFGTIVASLIKKRFVVQIEVLLFLLVAFVNLYCGMSSAGATKDVPYRVMWFTVPLTVCLIAEFVKKYKKVLLYSTLCVMVFCCCITLNLKAQTPYSWWGYTEEPLYAKTETVDIPMLKGFKFSPKEKKRYEELYKLVVENSTEEQTVLGFPYIKIINLVANRTNEIGFVPVYFFDVCSDSYAIEDAKKIKQNPPDILIWQDLTEECWNVHEEFFRKSDRMGQRDIQEWFVDVKNEKYDCIGQVGDVYVYKLKDNGTPTKYTYYEDENSNPLQRDENNLTASEDACRRES